MSIFQFVLQGKRPAAIVQAPYELFGFFFSSLITPGRLAALRATLSKLDSQDDEAEYTHDYTYVFIDKKTQIARLIFEDPVEEKDQICEMPLTTFCDIATRWLAFLAEEGIGV